MTFFGIRFWRSSVEDFRKQSNKHLSLFTRTINKLTGTNSSIATEQGLKEDDWVYDVSVRYLIPSNLPNVVEVNRHKFSNKRPEKVSLAERIRSFFPKFEPEWQPAF